MVFFNSVSQRPLVLSSSASWYFLGFSSNGFRLHGLAPWYLLGPPGFRLNLSSISAPVYLPGAPPGFGSTLHRSTLHLDPHFGCVSPCCQGSSWSGGVEGGLGLPQLLPITTPEYSRCWLNSSCLLTEWIVHCVHSIYSTMKVKAQQEKGEWCYQFKSVYNNNR